MRVLRWLPTLVLLVPWLIGPIAPSNEVRIRDLAAPSAFRLLDWETVHLSDHAARLWRGLFGSADTSAADAAVLQSYFRAGTSRAARRTDAEAALERVVAAVYTDAGLTRSQPLPVERLFPPVLVA